MTMHSQTKLQPVTISTFDLRRLKELLLVAKQFASPQPGYIGDLENELEQANIVRPEEVPPYIVTLNTCFKLTDVETGKEHSYTLVFPSDADPEENKLSILSDLGVAVLGCSAGDTIEWNFPDGVRHFRIDMICFQPEATRQYDL
jgi:regulator of nucleoside diphosphate kinase